LSEVYNRQENSEIQQHVQIVMRLQFNDSTYNKNSKMELFDEVAASVDTNKSETLGNSGYKFSIEYSNCCLADILYELWLNNFDIEFRPSESKYFEFDVKLEYSMESSPAKKEYLALKERPEIEKHIIQKYIENPGKTFYEVSYELYNELYGERDRTLKELKMKELHEKAFKELDMKIKEQEKSKTIQQ
ncbi:hypothetical protein LLG96_17270, partial [bacterium]|nr:hypothetical protein [bacterium]